MEFLVFTKAQNPTCDVPPHKATRTVAKLAITIGLARKVGQNALQQTTDAPWRDVRRMARQGYREVLGAGYSGRVYEHHIEPRFETLSPVAHELSYEYIRRCAR